MSAEAAAAPEARAPRGEGRRGPRPEREREPRPAPVADEVMPPVQAFADTLPAAPVDAAALAAEAGERDATKRRRRRGGRGRGRDEGGAEGSVNAAGEEMLAGEQAVDSAPTAAEAEFTQAPQAAEHVPAAEPRRIEAETARPPAPTPVAAPVMVTAVAPASVPAAVVAPYHLPTDTLAAVASGAGLQWVNSDADKIRAVQDAMANEPRPIHVPRQPTPRAVLDDGPLVLVETKKDLSQVRLPFDA